MDIKKEFTFTDGNKYIGTYHEPEECPLCKFAIQPHNLHISSYPNSKGDWFITGLYLCKHCYRTFTTLSECKLSSGGAGPSKRTYSSHLLYCGPSMHQDREFQEKIIEISPDFVRIYNQAKAAEEADLDEICGIGYRKALEFLVKDYLVHKNPDSRPTIERMELGNCIANKVEEPDIRLAASRCAWLGNDEAHYYRRFKEYDIETLKQLLEATIYWVSMKLAVEMAEGIEPRR